MSKRKPDPKAPKPSNPPESPPPVPSIAVRQGSLGADVARLDDALGMLMREGVSGTEGTPSPQARSTKRFIHVLVMDMIARHGP